MLQELFGNRLRVDSGSHVVMALVPENTDELCCQGRVQNTHDSIAIGTVIFGHGAILNVLARTPADGFNVGHKGTGLLRRFFRTHERPQKMGKDVQVRWNAYNLPRSRRMIRMSKINPSPPLG